METDRAAGRLHDPMPRTYKNYDDEFKRNAVELCTTSTRPLAQIARELSVSTNTLRNWCKQLLGASGGEASPVGAADAVASPEQLLGEIRQLRKENLHLRRQQEILKKAAVILGTNPHTSDSQ